MPEISPGCVVVAVHSRRERAEALVKRLQEQGLQTALVLDRRPPQPARGENRNHLRAMGAALAVLSCTHLVVLQDDAVVGDWFADELSRRITAEPSSVLGLYLGNHRPWEKEVGDAVNEARTTPGTLWLDGDTLYYGVGTVFPRNVAVDVLNNADPRIKGYDTMVGTRFLKTGTRVLYTWPSMVDHADDLPTTIPGRSKANQGERKAHFLDRAPESAWGVVPQPSRVVRIKTPDRKKKRPGKR